MRRLLIAGMLAIALSACTHAGPAHIVLAGLADPAQSERIAAGTAMVGVGMAIGVASGLFLMDMELGIYGLIAGGRHRGARRCASPVAVSVGTGIRAVRHLGG